MHLGSRAAPPKLVDLINLQAASSSAPSQFFVPVWASAFPLVRGQLVVHLLLLSHPTFIHFDDDRLVQDPECETQEIMHTYSGYALFSAVSVLHLVSKVYSVLHSSLDRRNWDLHQMHRRHQNMFIAVRWRGLVPDSSDARSILVATLKLYAYLFKRDRHSNFKPPSQWADVTYLLHPRHFH